MTIRPLVFIFLAVAANCEFALPKDLSMQARSFVDNLEGNSADDWPTSTYDRYWMHMAHHDNPAHIGVRTKTHKLIFFYGRKLNDKWFWSAKKYHDTDPYWELYDIDKDPKEMNSVIDDSSYAEVLGELKAELIRLREQVGDTDSDYPIVNELMPK